MMMVAVVPQRQADRQIHHPAVSVVAGSSPEECPKAVKLLFAMHLRGEGESSIQPTPSQAADATGQRATCIMYTHCCRASI